jgi:hypothetical protein
MYKKIIISEQEKNRIKNLYSVTEQQINPIGTVMQAALDRLGKLQRGEVQPDDYSTDSDTSVGTGSYYTNPNYDSVKIIYRPSAVKLNKDAEILLQSIAKDAGLSEVTVSSTLRTYTEQARANFSNSPKDILAWYGNEVFNKWKELKRKYGNNKPSFEQTFGDFLEKRDKQRGKPISKHLTNRAIDIVPFISKFASAGENLAGKPNTGVEEVLREPENGATHIVFTFPVTGPSGVVPTSTQDTLASTSTDGIIIDTKLNNSNEYALIYGGYPSSKYGAQFMQQKGRKYLNKNVIYADKEKSLDIVQNELKKINPNARITSVSGFSGGGANALRALDSGKFKFIGLIDPYITSVRNSLPSNVKMISRAENWTSYPKVREVLVQMERNDTSEKIADTTYNHDEMPNIFFQKYGNLI